MSEHSTRPSSTVDDEIDLKIVFRGFQRILKTIIKGLLNFLSFYFNHKFILIGLLALGIILGFLYDKNFDKIYTNEVLLHTNYSSTDYVYNKVEAFNKKLNVNDSIFLKNIFKEHYEQVQSVKIEPVVDIYNFVSRDESNKDLFELLFEEEADIEFLENPINSKNYKQHRIYLSIKGEDNHEKLTDIFIQFLNDSEYYENINVLSLESLDFRLEKNKEIIKQIDSILADAKKSNSYNLESGKFSFSDNQGLNNLLNKKQDLVQEQMYLKVEKVNQTESIKKIDSNIKVLDKEDFLKKDRIKLFPLLFIIIYSVIFFLKFLYLKAKNITS